jgi:hypothetical protein
VVTREAIQAVIEQQAGDILSLPGVVGIGEAADSAGQFISVLVANADAAVLASIPPTLGGYRVQVQVTGRLRAGETG